MLATFAWAFPHQYRPAAAPGTAVQLDFGSGGLRRLTRGPEGSPAAALRMPPRLAWRQLTGLPVPAGDFTTAGADRLIAPLLTVRGIIA